MNAKILLIALSAAAFTSCSTAYKSTQTPDDVYYSPVRAVDESRSDNSSAYERQYSSSDDSRIRMVIRDYRWRDFYDDYDYSYRYSPYSYSYCNCTCNNYGYYYNPYYSRRPLYYPAAYYSPAVNTTPRMVNLDGYKNYAAAVNNNPKTGSGGSYNPKPARVYNNNNNGESRFGRVVREVISPSNNNSSNNSSPSNNNTRTYSPSSSSGSSSSGSSSGGSSSGSVSRPGRG